MKVRSRFYSGVGIAFCICIFVFTNSTAFAAKQSFQKTFGGVGYDEGWSVQQTSDGGYIIAGYTSSYGAGAQDVYLIKTDSNGKTQWEKTFGSPGSENAYSVQQTTDGGYIMAGVNANADVLLMKTNSVGTLLWERSFGGGGADIGRSVQQTIDGGYIIAGSTSSFGNWNQVYLVKTDASGTLQWEKNFGGGFYDEGLSCMQTTDGGYIITGRGNWMGSETGDVYLIKADSAGNLQWENFFDWAGTGDIGFSVRQTNDGGYIITGATAPSADVYLIKTDNTGSAQWQTTIGGLGYEIGYSVQQTLDSGYIIAGAMTSFGSGGDDVYLIKTDVNGNLQWQNTFGGAASDKGFSVKQTADGGYIVAGYTASFGAGGEDVYLIKTNSSGN